MMFKGTRIGRKLAMVWSWEPDRRARELKQQREEARGQVTVTTAPAPEPEHQYIPEAPTPEVADVA